MKETALKGNYKSLKHDLDKKAIKLKELEKIIDDNKEAKSRLLGVVAKIKKVDNFMDNFK